MVRKIVSGIMSALILISAIFSSSIRVAEASGTIYIRADGSIDPPTAPISTVDNVTYTFADNIYDEIVVERDNIIVDGAGYMVQGTMVMDSIGIYLDGRSNVTIKNMTIETFYYGIYLGIYLGSSNYNSIAGNNITNNRFGIMLWSSSNYNNISGNNITNGWYGILFWSSSNYNSISGNNITNNNGGGIDLHDSSNYNSISGNNITNGWSGIVLGSSSNNSISGNNITANSSFGIYLGSSSNNSISGNTFTNNGLFVSGSYQNSVENNSVNGRPLVYLEGVSNYTVDEAGQVVLVRCENITVEGLNLSRTDVGIELSETSNSTISGNNIVANNREGIWLDYSSNNSISGNNITANNNDGIYLYSSSNYNNIVANNITNNYYGIYRYSGSSNSIFHNNFVNNSIQAYSTSDSASIWDGGYPSGGNYWSDYNERDLYCGPYQNVTGSDGIGDTPYVIDGNNRDNYPLMKTYPWAAHDVGVTNVATSKSIVGEGFSTSVNMMMFNYGIDTETVNATISANQIMIGEMHNVDLGSRNSTAITYTWNTTDFGLGNYTISAYALPVPDETDTADNNFTGGWIVVAGQGDLTGGTPNAWDFVPDGKVDVVDVATVAKCFGQKVPPAPANCDVSGTTVGVPDGKIDITDVATVAKHFGQHYPYP